MGTDRLPQTIFHSSPEKPFPRTWTILSLARAFFMAVLNVTFGQCGHLLWTCFLMAMEEATPLESAQALTASSTMAAAPPWVERAGAAEAEAEAEESGLLGTLAQKGIVFLTLFLAGASAAAASPPGTSWAAAFLGVLVLPLSFLGVFGAAFFADFHLGLRIVMGVVGAIGMSVVSAASLTVSTNA